jgi:hypothetical protein
MAVVMERTKQLRQAVVLAVVVAAHLVLEVQETHLPHHHLKAIAAAMVRFKVLAVVVVQQTQEQTVVEVIR